MSRVFLSDSNKKSYDPCYLFIGYTVLTAKGVKFQLPTERIKSCSLCYMLNFG